MAETRTPSYWMETAPGPDFAALEDDLTVDVVVLGAGIAGLSTAWELARSGRSVAVLEADRVAADTTGFTTAKVSAQHTVIYAELARSFGTEGARRFATSQQQAVERVAGLAAELGIACDLERRPAYTYCTDPAGVEDLRAEAAAAASAGLPATFVTESPLPFPIAGAVRVEDQAQFHPRRYLLGLVEAMTGQGVRIFEHSRAVRLRAGAPCRVEVEHGATVSARDVVIATHYPAFDRGLHFARLEPHGELVVAGAISADDDPGGMYITPEGDQRSVRTAPLPDGRRLVIVTGEKHPPGSAGPDGTSGRLERLRSWMREHFAVEDPTYTWYAQDNSTPDRVPYIGRFHAGTKHVFVATGFGGWGMTNGVLAGQLLSGLIDGQAPEWADLYDPVRFSARREAATLAKAQAKVGVHFVADRARALLRRSDDVSRLSPGQGVIVSEGVQPVAVYRDDDGSLHAVSATCTHLGCTVQFDDVQREWACPCHGSRFSVAGEVLHGPAVRPLARRDLTKE